MLNIHFNGVHCSEYGLTPLKGCLAELMKPAKAKDPIKNTNKAINGDVVALYHGKLQSRSISLFFHIDGGDGTLETLQDKVDALIDMLLDGESGSHVNRVFVEEINRTFWLHYIEVSDFTNISESGRATIRIKFLESNPTNNAE